MAKGTKAPKVANAGENIAAESTNGTTANVEINESATESTENSAEVNTENTENSAEVNTESAENSAEVNTENTENSAEKSSESTEKSAEKSTESVVATIKATKKQPPLKNGKRSSGTRGARVGGKPTYNFAEASYADITNFLRHILNGCYVPVYNGHPGKDVNTSEPVYKTLEDAAKANAVEFGYRSDLPHFVGYKQNIQLAKAGCNQFTSIYKPATFDANGKMITEPEQSYHCFLTATSLEDVAKAKQNLADYEALPWNANQKSMITKWLNEPYQLTFPAPAATLGSAPAVNTAVNTAAVDAAVNTAADALESEIA